jgi:hypothetical protein
VNNISIFCDTGGPENYRDWLKPVALLMSLINVVINKVVLTANKPFSVFLSSVVQRSLMLSEFIFTN